MEKGRDERGRERRREEERRQGGKDKWTDGWIDKSNSTRGMTPSGLYTCFLALSHTHTHK